MKIAIIENYNKEIIQCLGVTDNWKEAYGIAFESADKVAQDYDECMLKMTATHSINNASYDIMFTYKIINKNDEEIASADIYFFKST